MIDNYIMDQSPRITMTLSEILANTPPVQTLAQATDVPGANLEWMKTAAYPTGAWYGNLGELGTTAFRDALFTGYLASGVTCKVSGVTYSWGGAGAGWVAQRATNQRSETDGTIAVRPGGVDVFGIILSPATFVTGTSNLEYHWIFATGGTVPVITWPAGITWSGSAPTLVGNKKYEISILNSLAVWGQF